MRNELGDQLDWNRIHLLGKIPYNKLITVFQISSAHIYFTYPFVLSWSMLEAMSCECLVLGSRTKPVQEVIKDNLNGLLIEFSDIEGLASQLLKSLFRPEDYMAIRAQARETIIEKYKLKSCLKARLNLIDKITNF